jgi:hypothetical protein
MQTVHLTHLSQMMWHMVLIGQSVLTKETAAETPADRLRTARRHAPRAGFRFALGNLLRARTRRRRRGRHEAIAGKLDEHFPLYVWQTGMSSPLMRRSSANTPELLGALGSRVTRASGNRTRTTTSTKRAGSLSGPPTRNPWECAQGFHPF